MIDDVERIPDGLELAARCVAALYGISGKHKHTDLLRLVIRVLIEQYRGLDRCKSALRVIQTWAEFEYEGLPKGHALVPEQVAELCKKTLGH